MHFERGGHLDMLYDQQKMVEQLEAVEPGAGRRVAVAFKTFLPGSWPLPCLAALKHHWHNCWPERGISGTAPAMRVSNSTAAGAAALALPFTSCAGGQYLSWLASARAALEAGMAAFIEKDFDTPLDMLDLSKLLPLLPRLNVLELLGQHHGQ